MRIELIDWIDCNGKNIENIVRLYMEVFSAPPRDEKEIERQIREHIEKGVLLIAVKKDKVVGIFGAVPLKRYEDGENVIKVLSANGIDVDENDFIMSMLAVSEEYRGRRVGSILCHHGEIESFEKSGRERFFSRTRKDALEMNALLTSRGYRLVAEEVSEKYIWLTYSSRLL